MGEGESIIPKIPAIKVPSITPSMPSFEAPKIHVPTSPALPISGGTSQSRLDTSPTQGDLGSATPPLTPIEGLPLDSKQATLPVNSEVHLPNPLTKEVMDIDEVSKARIKREATERANREIAADPAITQQKEEHIRQQLLKEGYKTHFEENPDAVMTLVSHDGGFSYGEQEGFSIWKGRELPIGTIVATNGDLTLPDGRKATVDGVIRYPDGIQVDARTGAVTDREGNNNQVITEAELHDPAFLRIREQVFKKDNFTEAVTDLINGKITPEEYGRRFASAIQETRTKYANPVSQTEVLHPNNLESAGAMVQELDLQDESLPPGFIQVVKEFVSLRPSEVTSVLKGMVEDYKALIKELDNPDETEEEKRKRKQKKMNLFQTLIALATANLSKVKPTQ